MRQFIFYNDNANKDVCRKAAHIVEEPVTRWKEGTS